MRFNIALCNTVTEPMIDIMMSTFNGARFLSEQIDSILSQDHAEFRLLVRDDGSSDDTIGILNAYASRDRRVVRLNDELGNLGASASFFVLIARSEANLLMLSDQDDAWLPDKISRTLDRMNDLIEQHGNETPLAVFTDLKVVDENLEVVNESFWEYQKLDPSISRDWRSLLAQNVVTGCTLMINRASKSAVLPCELSGMQHDHWIAAKIAKLGHIGFVAEPTVLYRQHGANVEGARKVDLFYLFSKMLKLPAAISAYRRTARTFGDISAARLIGKKLALNLKRLS
ncbi:MAG: glycosyltransferase family 2 protein [Acidobacteria bacterium]|nr:glycosyltransferase family 2 protein [Acidobacteriota bacterium]